MKLFQLFSIGLLSTVLLGSCEKDNSVYSVQPVSVVAQHVIYKQWNLKEVRSKVGGGTWQDITATYPICLKDDIINFKGSGIFSVDDYNYKCNSQDPRFKSNGTWYLSNNETVLSMSDENGITSIKNIVSIDTVAMVLSDVVSGTTTEYTFRH